MVQKRVWIAGEDVLQSMIMNLVLRKMHNVMKAFGVQAFRNALLNIVDSIDEARVGVDAQMEDEKHG